MLNYVFFSLVLLKGVFSQADLFGHYEGYAIPPPDGLDDVGAKAVSTFYFTQTLDHFDPTNTIRFSQRYFVNTQYFNSTAQDTVFLLIGGEGQAAIQWMSAGAWIQTAAQYGALLFQLEHRYYGMSHPLSTLSTSNLRFLSSQQALEDIATFISAMNEEYNLASNVKWILFGGSYSGSLAVWARQKYPHLIQGAMSSSAPLLAKVDFYDYFRVVRDSVATHSQQCVDTIRDSFIQLEGLLANPGSENITAMFNLCFNIDDSTNRIDENIAYLFERLANSISGVVQYTGISGSTTISTMCNILTNPGVTRAIDRFSNWIRALYSSSCLNYRYQSLITSLSNTAVSASRNSRQWYYQTCTEYGWYQTSSQIDQVFGNRNPVEFFTKICSDVFGTQFNQNFTGQQADRINRHYGGFEIAATNVVHVHGSLDPWNPVGITETVNPTAPVVFIRGTSHVADLYPRSARDPPELTEARTVIDRLIGLWLGRSSAVTVQLSFSLILIGILAKLF